jgi:perosamine synthetase
MEPRSLDAAARGVVPFHLPSIGEEEIAEVVATLRSGWLTTGARVRQFERDFAAYVGVPHAVAVTSCTAALHLALEAVGVGADDEVILPTYTFTATGEVATYLGARPVLADCRADTFNVDAATIESLLTPRTRAIVPVHIAGQSCDMDPILELARDRELPVIDDAAHALATRYRGRPVGSLADLSAFSFYPTKTITTGEGGMVTTRRADYADRIRMMSLHGLSHDAWNRYAERGSWYYEVCEFGFKYNMPDLAAALGIHQLRRVDELVKRRREIAARYDEAFAGLDTCVVPREAEHGTHAWHLYVLQLELAALSVGRAEIVRDLAARGIGTSVHFIPLHLQPAYRDRFGYRAGAFPNAERLFARAVSLPIYPRMSDDDVVRVVDAVLAALRAHRR